MKIKKTIAGVALFTVLLGTAVTANVFADDIVSDNTGYSTENDKFSGYDDVKYIGCNSYIFMNDDGKTGLLNENGDVVIEPKYCYNRTYAINNTATFQDGDRFDIYDTERGELKKSIENPLGYELTCPKHTEKYDGKCYRIMYISGSNIVVYEHLGDMVFEETKEQDCFIIRLFSEKKAAEDYYSIRAWQNGEFTAVKRTDDKSVVLNADGSFKCEVDVVPLSRAGDASLKYLDDGLYYGYDTMWKGIDLLELEKKGLVNVYNGNGKLLVQNIDYSSITVDSENKLLKGKKDGNDVTINYGDDKAEESTAANTNKSECSAWAKDEITEAVNKGILPEKYQSDYTSPITREDFCSLIINTLRVQNPEILNSADTSEIAFTDTNNSDVITAYALGVVSGVGDSKFNPNGKITRQEAARMLYMAATISERIKGTEGYFDWRFIDNNKKLNFPYMFDDISKFEHWASLGIQYCYQNEIMFGVGQNNFDPSGNYSREQAYLTVLRLYKKFNGENIKSNAEYDNATGKFIYNGNAYDKVYTTYKNKTVVLKDNKLSLIDDNGNTIIDDIGKNISMLSNPDAYVYDCYGDLIIVMQPLYNRTGNNSIYGYEAVLYKSTGESLWAMPNNLHFTESGGIITVDENDTGYSVDGNHDAKAVYILLDPETYGQEGYSNKTVAVYKK